MHWPSKKIIIVFFLFYTCSCIADLSQTIADPKITQHIQQLHKQANQALNTKQYEQAEQLLGKEADLYQQLLQKFPNTIPDYNAELFQLRVDELEVKSMQIFALDLNGQYDNGIILGNQLLPKINQLYDMLGKDTARFVEQPSFQKIPYLIYESLTNVYSDAATYAQQLGDESKAESLLTSTVNISNDAIRRTHELLNYAKQNHAPLSDLTTLQLIVAQRSIRLVEHYNQLAALYTQQARITEAQPLLAQAQQLLADTTFTPSLTWYEKLRYWATEEANSGLPLDQKDQVNAFQNMRITAYSHLSMTYTTLKAFTQAQTLQTQAAQLARQSWPEQDARLLNLLHPQINLAMTQGDTLQDQRYYRQAETLIKNGIALAQAQQPPDMDTANNFRTLLGGNYQRQERYNEALPFLEQGLKATAPEVAHQTASNPAIQRLQAFYNNLLHKAYLNNLGQTHAALGHYQTAQDYFTRNVNDADNQLPPAQPGSKAESWQWLALTHADQQQIQPALTAIQHAREELASFPLDNLEQQGTQRTIARTHLNILMQGVRTGKLTTPDTLEQIFQTAQQAHDSNNQALFKQTLLREAAQNPRIREQLAPLQASQAQLQQLSQQLTGQAVSGDTTLTPLQFAQKRQQLAADIQTREQQLQSVFPAYAELKSPKLATISQLQSLLKPHEALLLWVESQSSQRPSYLLLLRADRPLRIYPLSIYRDLLAKDLETAQQGLRATLTNPHQAFDVDQAFRLYQQLLAPAAADLAGITHLIAVPDGLLQNLPLSTLVMRKPTDPHAYDQADWLLKHYAVSYLPHVSALVDLRRTRPARSISARLALIGFGDPVLHGNQTTFGRLFRGLESPTQRGADAINVLTEGNLLQDTLSALPETAQELQNVANTLPSTQRHELFLRKYATETQLKQLNAQGTLQNANIISFATHALLPREAAQQQLEAGLVLTPPKIGTSEDDGLLTVSEISRLHLDADWVLLSACNTATLQDTDAYQGLSALAKAFFLAGSRSVLATQWSVNSQVTTQLVSDVFTQLRNQPQLSRAEALRLSMLKIAQTPTPSCGILCQIGWQKPPLAPAHPFYWAPFAIYGEWGAL